MIKALDISKHQSTFNAVTAKSNGVEMVICRCAYATSKDVKWDTFAPSVKNSGMTLGAYGFLTAHYQSKNGGSLDQAQVVMRQQVSTWIGLCKQRKCSVLAVDQELEAGNAMTLSKTDNTTLLIEACQLIEQNGIKPLIYCSASWAKSYIDTSRCKYPFWIAYYYADPNDPDFDGCKPIEQVNTTYGRYMVSLGSQLYGWQFGRIGYGSKYGVGSDNVDKNIIYYKEDKPMEFTPVSGKILVCTSSEKPTCETFYSADVNASLGKLGLGQECDVVSVGGNIDIAGMTGTWYKILNNGNEEYCLYLPDGRCEIKDKPVEPEKPVVDNTEVLEAISALDSKVQAIANKLDEVFK